MSHELSKSIPGVPTDSGVYLMKDDNGVIIYVGKAVNLKKRLSSYFTKENQRDPKTAVLVKKIVSFETILTATEKEALILESNLIKKHRPRYNVILKDDKRYPSLRIDPSEPYPNITVVRKMVKDKSRYFGPFSSPGAVKETLKFINKTFKLRKCKTREVKKRNRPCLNYQMKACLAPCVNGANPSEYREMVNEVVLFLKGRTPELIHKVKEEMQAAAEAEDFEKAADLRDKMFALQKTVEKQVVVTSDLEDRDVFALLENSTHALVTLLTVRNGFLRGSRSFYFHETMATRSELMTSVIRQYYDETRFIPKEIMISLPLESASVLEEVLSEIKGKRIKILHPLRGEKKQLVNMALQNAAKALKEQTESDLARSDLLKRLQARLDLKHFPGRIECFDNSNLSGKSAVAGMVVFEAAAPAKAFYRKFNIKSMEGPDDYAHMREVLQRRFSNAEGIGAFPDLVMVDGGKGQLNIAVDVIKNLGLEKDFDVIAIAKKDVENQETADKIFKPNRANPINFQKDQDLLLFLQRIRDEAHRFAISFHRSKRNARSLHSVLDDIHGIGKKRKAMLLRHFGSIKKIREATLEDLGSLPGMNETLASAVLKVLQS
ncbi:MAG: excinuclease ABC subunit UvrC [Proteobacteria bacterium]|nr:excinuclease ABC subunit UvrC [Pseudomonadota bacterium]